MVSSIFKSAPRSNRVGFWIWLFSWIGFILGWLFFFAGIWAFRRKRLVENVPTSKVRSLAMGRVEVYGKAEPLGGKPLKAPISQEDCLYYRFSIQEKRGSGKHSRWVTVAASESDSPFLLRDETGAVMVDPRGAEMDCLKNTVVGSGFMKDPPQHVKELLKSLNVPFEGSILGINKTMSYAESWLPPNLNLYVLGTAGDNPLVGEGSQEQGFADVMISKGKGAFLISKESEQEMLSGLSGTMWFGLVGGPILIAVCAWLLSSPYVS